MKVFVNATTLVVGGGVQVGISFIEHASKISSGENINFIFAVSRAIYESLSERLQNDARVVLIPVSPARIVNGYVSRLVLRDIEKRFKPDVVYSVGSPAYVRFSTKEVARFTDGWTTHPSRLAWSVLPISRRVRLWLKIQYKWWHLRKVSHFEAQTETAAKGIMNRLSLKPEQMRVIPNAVSPVFNGMDFKGKCHLINDAKVVQILTLAAPYPHKNLLIIPNIAAILKATSLAIRWRFTVTLPSSSSFTKQFMKAVLKLKVEDCIENVGRVNLRDCPALYGKAHIVFVPSLLETFSVTYLEAMHMGCPIVTTDINFAHDTCGNAALYFDPLSASSAADAILRLVKDPKLRGQQVYNGKKRLQEFPKPHEKYQKVIDWIRTVGTEQHDPKS